MTKIETVAEEYVACVGVVPEEREAVEVAVVAAVWRFNKQMVDLLFL